MRSSRTSLALTLLLVGAAVLHRPFQRVVWSVIRFPLVVAHSVVRGAMRLPALPSLQQENASLRQELTASRLDVARLQEALRHTAQSQHLLQATGGSGVVAAVIARPLVPSRHLVVIDRGSKDGLAPSAVLVEAEGLVGRLLQVDPTTSTAMLLTDPDSRVAVLVERSRESGLAVGTGGALLQLDYLDLDADIAVNDRVVTAGLGGAFPTGLLVGTVVRVERDERRAAARAWVRPAVRFGRLEDMVCLR